jgi:hypothetical protein
LSRYEYITEKKLYKALRKRIKKEDANSFLDDLVKESEIYRYIHEPPARSVLVQREMERGRSLLVSIARALSGRSLAAELKSNWNGEASNGNCNWFQRRSGWSGRLGCRQRLILEAKDQLARERNNLEPLEPRVRGGVFQRMMYRAPGRFQLPNDQ